MLHGAWPDLPGRRGQSISARRWLPGQWGAAMDRVPATAVACRANPSWPGFVLVWCLHLGSRIRLASWYADLAGLPTVLLDLWLSQPWLEDVAEQHPAGFGRGSCGFLCRASWTSAGRQALRVDWGSRRCGGWLHPAYSQHPCLPVWPAEPLVALPVASAGRLSASVVDGRRATGRSSGGVAAVAMGLLSWMCNVGVEKPARFLRGTRPTAVAKPRPLRRLG